MVIRRRLSRNSRLDIKRFMVIICTKIVYNTYRHARVLQRLLFVFLYCVYTRDGIPPSSCMYY